MTSVAVLDYGVGNLFSMSNALKRAGLNVKVTGDPEEISSADAIVLPGVGNFGHASTNLKPFADSIRRALEADIPMMGSCLGMAVSHSLGYPSIYIIVQDLGCLKMQTRFVL